MKKRYCILLVIICAIGILLFGSSVKATEIVTDREMAITSAYTYMTIFQKGKKVTEGLNIGKYNGISKIVSNVNSKFNLHNYATAKELDEWVVDDYRGLGSSIKQNGLNLVRTKKDNDIIIAITGSASPVDAYEDIKYGILNYSSQEKYLKQYIKLTLEEYSKKDGSFNFYITGHSLGGYLAQIAGAEMEDLITSNTNYKNLKLAKVVDFNGIGINFLTLFGNVFNLGGKENTIKTLKELGDDGRLIEYYVYGDLVSALGVHYGEMRMVTPSIDSITYHRANYKILGNMGRTLVRLAEKQTVFNAFKTSLEGAERFYSVNNIAAYLNLTHEIDHFVTLNPGSSENKPNVKIIENKNVLSTHITSGQKEITITKSTKLKALTEFASAKKYEWYESSDEKDWKLIKTVDLYNLNGEVPTNILDVDINSIATGKSKYYKVVSYYDDNYTSSRYNYNQKTKQYEYIETDKSKTTNYEPVSAVIKVTHKKSIWSIFKR